MGYNSGQEAIDVYIHKSLQKQGIPFSPSLESKQQILQEIRQAYTEKIKLMHINTNNDGVFFSWLNQPLKIHIIITPGNTTAMNSLLMFATETSSSDDELFFQNSSSEVTEYKFQSWDKEKQLSYLISEGLLEITPESIIKSSIQAFTSLSLLGEVWADNEFNAAGTHFKLKPVELLKFNEIGLHADKYAFKIITDEIANDQFSVELDECLTAFEHELYYVCASGFGGILESILYFSLINYGLTGRGFPKDPTTSNFINILKSNKLIDQRQESYIKSIFMIRNSVSHHNSGFTSVSQCQTMMLGVKDLFTNIYQPSQAWHQAHPGLSYKEYLKNH